VEGSFPIDTGGGLGIVVLGIWVGLVKEENVVAAVLAL